ncbi:hypothetical protein [Fulvivirga sp. M361]|uniref:hypothetical protein n=1 Tax=Fulvivirga sp. M361 TaxID=2594266 RepID=UPI00162985E9|nr:hypothetical protein [Fulvivirga sp. M361]
MKEEVFVTRLSLFNSKYHWLRFGAGFNNHISSIQINNENAHRRVIVEVYEDKDYRGRRLRFRVAGQDRVGQGKQFTARDLRDYGFDDQISSIKVYH